MNEKELTKKELAFALFDKGYGPSSPEIKELKLRGSTRYSYISEWRKRQGATSSPQPTITDKPRKTASKATSLPGGESISSLDETKMAIKPEAKPEKPKVKVAATSVEEESTEEPEDIEEKPEGKQVKEGVETTEEGRDKMASCYCTFR